MGALLASLFLKPHSCTKTLPAEVFAKRSKLPVPKIIHKVLTPGDIGNNDVLIIGDVHGCLDELQQVISIALAETDDRCVFIFCGDILNKGPLSKETLDYIRNLGCQAHVIRGNHDNHVLEHSYALRTTNNTYNGRVLDQKPKYSWIPSLSESDLEYLRELPYTISVPHLGALVVHAGLFPWTPLCCQDPIVMTKMRNISGVDGVGKVMPEEDFHKGVPWASLWPGPQHVYFGHDARRGLQTYPYATGLDTGCVYGGALTAYFLSGRNAGSYITVKSSQSYVKPRDKLTAVTPSTPATTHQ